MLSAILNGPSLTVLQWIEAILISGIVLTAFFLSGLAAIALILRHVFKLSKDAALRLASREATKYDRSAGLVNAIVYALWPLNVWLINRFWK